SRHVAWTLHHTVLRSVAQTNRGPASHSPAAAGYRAPAWTMSNTPALGLVSRSWKRGVLKDRSVVHGLHDLRSFGSLRSSRNDAQDDLHLPLDLGQELR